MIPLDVVPGDCGWRDPRIFRPPGTTMELRMPLFFPSSLFILVNVAVGRPALSTSRNGGVAELGNDDNTVGYWTTVVRTNEKYSRHPLAWR